MTTAKTDSDNLLALERQFWNGDAAFYRQHLDDTCLVAFTQMSGAFDKSDIAATVKDGTRWRDVDLKIKGIIEPAPGVAILTYWASAKRPDGAPYEALVSSGYVKRGQGGEPAWKMVFHQQTPLPDETGAKA